MVAFYLNRVQHWGPDGGCALWALYSLFMGISTGAAFQGLWATFPEFPCPELRMGSKESEMGYSNEIGNKGMLHFVKIFKRRQSLIINK